MAGAGVPMVKVETLGRGGKIEGQPAHTREAKLGCVFTQTTVDAEGRPVRDETSTTYSGAIETAEPFGRRLYAEACQRGWLGICPGRGLSTPPERRVSARDVNLAALNHSSFSQVGE